MKICVTAQGKTLDDQVDPRFGRCQFFIIVDTDTLAFEAFENQSAQFAGGAGIQSGQFMASKGVKAVLTGNVGPNAFQTLRAAGIEIYTGLSGKIRDAIDKYKGGALKPADNPSVGSKFGMPGAGKGS
ncbi:MAG: NifB/NifX family molybdenum-iron cluster-binding protein [Candidatus Omnitrophica bacterium]|nr:NifB/NifX family molybdenum-iron cluster-binding protein [Candidatus Omnitrophota bacterium]MCM8791508.1 NifB/NifX family molybdenum-iron cluster-binding protein [Candidatus Omnitrophota bacterium]